MGDGGHEGVLASIEWLTWIVLCIAIAVFPCAGTIAALGVALLVSAGLRIWRSVRRGDTGPASSG